MSTKQSAKDSHQRFDKARVNRKSMLVVLILLAVITAAWNVMVLVLYLVLLFAFFSVRLYIKRQRIADRPVSTIRGASRG